MRVYVSGPMTGLPDLNFPAFRAAADRLRAMGHDVVDPSTLGEPDGWCWEDFLRRDLRHLLDCDAICLLDGWWKSRGARLEQHVAAKLGYTVILERDLWA